MKTSIKKIAVHSQEEFYRLGAFGSAVMVAEKLEFPELRHENVFTAALMPSQRSDGNASMSLWNGFVEEGKTVSLSAITSSSSSKRPNPSCGGIIADSVGLGNRS